ncbi:hypothetical protein JCM10914A_16220 [Paenibacillus sp. JCM 10914]
MKLYPEMFISPWHLIVLVLVIIAFIGLIMGGYDRKTVLRCTGISAIVFYCLLTIPVGLVTQNYMYTEETMIQEMDRNFEERADLVVSPDDYVIAHVGAYKRNEYANILVYVGNYHETESFSGQISVLLKDMDGNEVFTTTYDDVSLAPGQKIEVEKTSTSQPMETYSYNFRTHPQ